MGDEPTSSQSEKYHFQSSNRFLNISRLSPIETLRLGPIEYILALEADVQSDPKNAKAWLQLGIKQQENEQEGQAIAALKMAISLNPKLLNAWLSLSVSYTNERRREEAYNALKSWIENNDKYKHILERQYPQVDDNDQHRFITELFLTAAKILDPGENPDPDVHIGLGILYNMSKEFSKAIDCFKYALTKRPNDYVLWNKLGATLANAKQPENAIDAYLNALRINPLFIRAKFNLAITLVNLRRFKEAVQNLLQALSLQARNERGLEKDDSISGDEMSSNIWNTLRMCLRFLNRADLIPKCDARNLNGFRQDFEF
nr:7073_t:CDS:2 [Entrophospora candida]